EAGDKVDAAAKSEVEAEIAKLKELKAKEDVTSEELNKALEELNNKFHKIAEAMYQQAAQEQQAQGGAEEETKQDDNVVDADFREVDDQN
ncbi:MAG: molecular chaperone DnaK, partial [Paraclostridium sp.]